MKKTILILGAGTGGVVTASELRKHLRQKGHAARIIVFEKEAKNVFSPSLLWLMAGKRKPPQVYRNTTRIARKGIEIVMGTIESLNPEHITVTVSGKPYKGDYMVVCLGVEQSAEHFLDTHGDNFYTLAGATSLHDKLCAFSGGKIAVVVSSLPFKCPAAPYEAAMLIESFITKAGLKEKTEISLYTPEPGPMGVAGKVLSQAVRQLVEAKGIHYYPEYQLLNSSERTLEFANGTTAEYDLLAFTPTHRCPSVLTQSGLVGNSGWVEPNRETLETKFPNVYAIGDNTLLPLEMGKPLPKAGVFAHQQAEVVAHNIAEKISGGSAFKTFAGEGQCFLEVGGGRAGYAGGNFFATPVPDVKMKKPGLRWHWMKVWFEKYWFYKYF